MKNYYNEKACFFHVFSYLPIMQIIEEFIKHKAHHTVQGLIVLWLNLGTVSHYNIVLQTNVMELQI